MKTAECEAFGQFSIQKSAIGICSYFLNCTAGK